MNSATIGTDGLGIVAYRVTVNNRWNLRVAHCLDVECAAITTADIDTGGFAGLWPSIKIGSDGLPPISYVVSRDRDRDFLDDLKVAHCNDIACTLATVTTLDTPARVTQLTSPTIGADGLGLISYQDSPSTPTGNVKIKAAHCVDIACTSATLATIDTIPPNGGDMFGIGHASIATGGTHQSVVPLVVFWTTYTARR